VFMCSRWIVVAALSVATVVDPYFAMAAEPDGGTMTLAELYDLLRSDDVDKKAKNEAIIRVGRRVMKLMDKDLNEEAHREEIEQLFDPAILVRNKDAFNELLDIGDVSDERRALIFAVGAGFTLSDKMKRKKITAVLLRREAAGLPLDGKVEEPPKDPLLRVYEPMDEYAYDVLYEKHWEVIPETIPPILDVLEEHLDSDELRKEVREYLYAEDSLEWMDNVLRRWLAFVEQVTRTGNPKVRKETLAQIHGWLDRLEKIRKRLRAREARALGYEARPVTEAEAKRIREIILKSRQYIAEGDYRSYAFSLPELISYDTGPEAETDPRPGRRMTDKWRYQLIAEFVRLDLQEPFLEAYDAILKHESNWFYCGDGVYRCWGWTPNPKHPYGRDVRAKWPEIVIPSLKKDRLLLNILSHSARYYHPLVELEK